MNNHRQQRETPSKSAFMKVFNILSGSSSDKSSTTHPTMPEYDPYDRHGNLEDFLQAPEPAQTKSSRKASRAYTEASGPSGARISNSKPYVAKRRPLRDTLTSWGRDALEVYTAEAEYFERKKLGAKTEAKPKTVKRSISRAKAPTLPPQGVSNPFGRPSNNIGEAIKLVPKHSVHVQQSPHRTSHHGSQGSVSSRMTRMSDFMNVASDSDTPPPMPASADRPRMPRSNAAYPNSYRTEGPSRKGCTSTIKQTNFYTPAASSRPGSGRTERSSLKPDSRLTRSGRTDRTGSYPAESSGRIRVRSPLAGRGSPKPSIGSQARSNRTSNHSGSNARPPKPCQFCQRPASPSTQYSEIDLHLCSQCAANPSDAATPKTPNTRSLTTPTCRLCHKPIIPGQAVVEGTSHLCRPCADRAFYHHPSPKRSPTDPPCQACHNPVSPMHAILEANNYLCRPCADRAFPSPMAPPTPLKDPRHRSRSASTAGRRSRQPSPYTRDISEESHISEFDFDGPDEPIILIGTASPPPPAMPSQKSGPYAGRKIPPPSSVYPDSVYQISPPPSPPPLLPPQFHRPSAPSSIYSTRTSSPRRGYPSPSSVPDMPEIHPALRSQYQASAVDLSTLVPPSPMPKSAKGTLSKGKGKGRAATVADEDESESIGGTVRDTKFYAFYDEIIPKGGRGRGYGL